MKQGTRPAHPHLPLWRKYTILFFNQTIGMALSGGSIPKLIDGVFFHDRHLQMACVAAQHIVGRV
jgi:hypothetical protein